MSLAERASMPFPDLKKKTVAEDGNDKGDDAKSNRKHVQSARSCKKKRKIPAADVLPPKPTAFPVTRSKVRPTMEEVVKMTYPNRQTQISRAFPNVTESGVGGAVHEWKSEEGGAAP